MQEVLATAKKTRKRNKTYTNQKVKKTTCKWQDYLYRKSQGVYYIKKKKP